MLGAGTAAGDGCGVRQGRGAGRCRISASPISRRSKRIEIEPGDAPARVIVNSRTGTVVIGSHVRVTPAAVAHGSLSVTITERTDVSQPNSFSQGHRRCVYAALRRSMSTAG